MNSSAFARQAVNSPARAAPPEYVTNPLVPQRADPSCDKHTDVLYYFTGSVPAYDRIELLKASSLQGLAFAEPKVIWRKHEKGPISYHIWAPEIHFIGGRWYIYFAAGPKTSGEHLQFGPGHNSFTTSSDGSVDILVYHARPYRNIKGDPLYDPNRHTRVQRIEWTADGTPIFGVPVPDGPHTLAAEPAGVQTK